MSDRERFRMLRATLAGFVGRLPEPEEERFFQNLWYAMQAAARQVLDATQDRGALIDGVGDDLWHSLWSMTNVKSDHAIAG